jgi:hypothetical protein
VISSVDGARFETNADELRRIAQAHRLCLGGSGAVSATLDVDAIRLSADPVAEADRLTELVPR